MPELTPKLGIKKPLGNETVSRAAFNENWDIIDTQAQKNITKGATAPASPVEGDLWIDTSTSPNALKRYADDTWVQIGAVTPADIGAATQADLDAHLAEKVTDLDGVHGFRIETGNFTPYIYGSTTEGSNTYSSQLGHYTLQGNIVIATGRVQLSAKDANMEGEARIGGLPFVSAAGDAGYASSIMIGRISYIDYDTGYTEITGFVEFGQSYIRLFQVGDNVAFKVLDAVNIKDTTDIFFEAIYRKA